MSHTLQFAVKKILEAGIVTLPGKWRMLNHALQILDFRNGVVVRETDPPGYFIARQWLVLIARRQVAHDRTADLGRKDIVARKIVMHVFKEQVPARLIRLAGFLESGGAINKAERVTLVAGSNVLDDLVEPGVGPNSQRVQVQGTLIVSLRLLKIAAILERGGEPEMGVGVTRINFQRCLKLRYSVTPVLLAGTIRS